MAVEKRNKDGTPVSMVAYEKNPALDYMHWLLLVLVAGCALILIVVGIALIFSA